MKQKSFILAFERNTNRENVAVSELQKTKIIECKKNNFRLVSTWIVVTYTFVFMSIYTCYLVSVSVRSIYLVVRMLLLYIT